MATTPEADVEAQFQNVIAVLRAKENTTVVPHQAAKWRAMRVSMEAKYAAWKAEDAVLARQCRAYLRVVR